MALSFGPLGKYFSKIDHVSLPEVGGGVGRRAKWVKVVKKYRLPVIRQISSGM